MFDWEHAGMLINFITLRYPDAEIYESRKKRQSIVTGHYNTHEI